MYCKYIITLTKSIVNTFKLCDEVKPYDKFNLCCKYKLIVLVYFLKVVLNLTLGIRLKKARKSKGLTQDGLAKIIGTSRGVITNLELDKIDTPQPLIINTLCSVLEINKEWLLNGVGSMNEPSKNSKILSEIHSLSKGLLEEEQLYILDVIKAYKKHMKLKEGK